MVALVEAELVDPQERQRFIGDRFGDHALGAHLGVVAHASEQAVGDARGAAGTARKHLPAGGFERHVECAGAAFEDLFEFAGAVEVEPLDHPEAIAQRRREQRQARGCADQGEAAERQAHAARRGAAADHHVEREVLHGGVEHLFDAARQAVDLVDEEHIVLFQRGEDAGEVAHAMDGRARGEAQADAHLGGDDPGEGGFASPGGP